MFQSNSRLGQIANHLCPKELSHRLAHDAEDLAAHAPMVLGAAVLDIQASIHPSVILQYRCKSFVQGRLQLLSDTYTSSDHRKVLLQSFSLSCRLGRRCLCDLHMNAPFQRSGFRLNIQRAPVCYIFSHHGLIEHCIQATPDQGSVEPGGTVPGRILQSPGGVGRNIAQALAQLTRQPPSLTLQSASHQEPRPVIFPSPVDRSTFLQVGGSTCKFHLPEWKTQGVWSAGLS